MTTPKFDLTLGMLELKRIILKVSDMKMFYIYNLTFKLFKFLATIYQTLKYFISFFKVYNPNKNTLHNEFLFQHQYQKQFDNFLKYMKGGLRFFFYVIFDILYLFIVCYHKLFWELYYKLLLKHTTTLSFVVIFFNPKIVA